MRECENCHVAVKGNWETCPLCHTPLDTTKSPIASSYPDVPLRFNKQRITKWLALLSLIIIFTTFGLGFIWRGNIQWIQAALFGIMSMWLVVLTIVRKRRNLAKSLLYLLIILSLLCVYLDYLIGWTGWSTTFAVPIFCSSAVIGMFVSSRLMRMKLVDYILYLAAAAMLGLIPILFLIFGWVSTTIPSWISIGFSSFLLLLILFFNGSEIVRELQKRIFI